MKKIPRWLLPVKPDHIGESNTFLNALYDYPAASFPEKIAIWDGRKGYSFIQLYRGSINIAAELIKLGVQKGDVVMIIAEKCSEMAIIGPSIWKAGAVYVPIDPANPSIRNQYIYNSMRPKVIFIPPKYELNFSILTEVSMIFSFQEIDNYINIPSEAFDFPIIRETDLAYVMYTSGSTGNPKGVMIEHGSVEDYFYNHNVILKFSETSRCLSNAPFYFDVSIEDTFLPLSVGAFVYQFRGLHLGSIVLPLMQKEKITHLIAVSTILMLITGNGKRLQQMELSFLEMVMTGAELCDVEVINIWKKTYPNIRVINVYGPTEATIVCTAYTIERVDSLRKEFYPIGQPLPNVKTMLIDEKGLVITTPYIQGQLLIGGKQVMRGYWNDTAETDKAIRVIGGIRYYESGDICYIDNEGNFVFVGRRDEEVKLFGRRINLVEIKKCLHVYLGIKNTVVGKIFTQDRHILAVIICSERFQNSQDFWTIREKLRTYLPTYMIPDVIGVIKNPVLSPTGKSDERKIISILEEAAQKSNSQFYILDEKNRFIPLT